MVIRHGQSYVALPVVADGCTVFSDLANDPTLFEGEGDYQFDVYRKMKEENG